MAKDYSRGKIYKIEPINGEDGDIYIGSTTKERLSQRMTAHRKDYKYWKSGGKGDKITSYELFDKYGIENCNIYLLELVNATTLDEIKAREGFYIKSLKCVNKYVAGRTYKEYREDNKEIIKEMKKEYRINNIEKIKEQKKEYYINNKETINKKDVINYQLNKEKLLQTINCVCGSSFVLCGKTRHEKTIKHQNYIQSLEN
jgi:hypothetical protein